MNQQPPRCCIVVWLSLSKQSVWQRRRNYHQTFWQGSTAMATSCLRRVCVGCQCCPACCSPAPTSGVYTCGGVTCRGRFKLTVIPGHSWSSVRTPFNLARVLNKRVSLISVYFLKHYKWWWTNTLHRKLSSCSSNLVPSSCNTSTPFPSIMFLFQVFEYVLLILHLTATQVAPFSGESVKKLLFWVPRGEILCWASRCRPSVCCILHVFYSLYLFIIKFRHCTQSYGQDLLPAPLNLCCPLTFCFVV